MLVPLITLLLGLAIGYVLAHHQAKELLKHDKESVIQQEQQASRHIAEIQSQYDARLAELQQQHQREMQQHILLIKEQLKSSTEAVLRERSQELADTSNEQLAKVLTPLQSGIRQMQEAVEKSHQAHTEGMARLDESFRQGMEQAQRIGERADSLTRALTAENKSQGNFGELQLYQLLDNMGLEAGVQYTKQVTLRDKDGQALRNRDTDTGMQPDVILHFPDERDVVIDAKMSLTAYVDYHNATTDAERSDALKRHIESVRDHVKELALKNYSAYIHTGRVRLDYVIMYIPYDSAYQLALQGDAKLYNWAFKNNVVITSTQNLYALLRMIEICWRQQRQIENQEEIMKAANMIIERVQLFYERLLEADRLLGKTQEMFKNLKTSTGPSGHSIITSAKQLIEYGAQKPKPSKATKGQSPLPVFTDEDTEEISEQ